MFKKIRKYLLVFAAILLAAMASHSRCNAQKPLDNLTGVLQPYIPSNNRGLKASTPARPPEKGINGKATAVTKRCPQTPNAKKRREASPISITALRMEADNKEGWVLFVGKVKAIQKDMVLTAEKLRVYLDPKGKVKKVIAQGKVRVEQSGRVITSQKAEYDPSKEIVVFTGNPKAWQGKNVVMGKRIIYFVKEKRSTVEGGNGKVSAVLFPKEKKGK